MLKINEFTRVDNRLNNAVNDINNTTKIVDFFSTS